MGFEVMINIMNNESIVSKTEFFPGKLTNWEQKEQIITLCCDNKVLLQVHLLTQDIVRFRFSTTGYFRDDFSYAIKPEFSPAKVPFKVEEKEHYLRISTTKLYIQIQKEGLLCNVFDKKNQLLLGDDKGFHWEKTELGDDIVKMSKVAHLEENYFGLGDKSCHLNLRGERLQNWVTDCYGYNADTDPLYRAIPFYFGLNDGHGYGVFFDNSFRSWFDFARERKNATSFWAHGGEMNYYFISGPSLMDVARHYVQLTGTPELPPLWALGFHQCKWSYYPEEEVKRIAHTFRKLEIPCDAIYLDIDYMDAYRCFTWNDKHFPYPQKMIRELKEAGFQTVVIIDPGIKIDPEYQVFREGLENDYFCKRTNGPYVQGKVWPGECYFPDFTRPEVRNWWKGLFKDLVRKMDVSGVWNDMNEPAIFDVPSKTFPLDVRHDYDGHPTSHLQAHNVYGMQMSRASYEGLKEFAYPNRPFLITRATFAGGQRFASAWTGDNTASWEHLQLANIQSQRMSISGFSFVGSDIGGFNSMPDGELFVRWLQMGVFHPLCRVHSIGLNDAGDEAIDEEAIEKNREKGLSRDQEPWSFGEPYTSIAKKTIELRYQLINYLYTSMWQYVNRGTPVLRPISFLDQYDPETPHRMEEFGFGDHMLVCPISEPDVEGRYLYLPEGLWYDFNTEQPIKGEQEIWTDSSLETIPVYIRGGAVLPLAPVMQYTNEKIMEVLDLHVYYKLGQENSELYLDEGNGYDYLDGKYRLHNFEVKGEGFSCVLTQSIEGKALHPTQAFRIIFHGLPFRAKSCLLDGKEVELSYTQNTTFVEAKWNFNKVEVK